MVHDLDHGWLQSKAEVLELMEQTGRETATSQLNQPVALDIKELIWL